MAELLKWPIGIAYIESLFRANPLRQNPPPEVVQAKKFLAKRRNQVQVHLNNLDREREAAYSRNIIKLVQEAAGRQAEFNLTNNTQANDFFLMKDESTQAGQLQFIATQVIEFAIQLVGQKDFDGVVEEIEEFGSDDDREIAENN